VHNFNSSAVQGPIAFCAVALDVHGMKAAQTIKTIRIIELAPFCRQLL